MRSVLFREGKLNTSVVNIEDGMWRRHYYKGVEVSTKIVLAKFLASDP
jgi:hypothetical protein